MRHCIGASLLVLAACGGDGDGGGSGGDEEPASVCALRSTLGGAREGTYASERCSWEAPGNFVVYRVDDDGSSIVETSIRWSVTGIAVGTTQGRFEVVERRSGEHESWIASGCTVEVTTSNFLGNFLFLADREMSKFQVDGSATCPDATQGTSVITVAPFEFRGGVVQSGSLP